MSSRSERTRQAIVEAAAGLWQGRGLHAAGLEEVAAAAGVTRRTIYLHFGGKAALLLAVVDQAERAAGLPELVARLREARTPEEILERLADIQVQYVPRIYESIRLVHAARREEPAADEVWNGRMRGRRAAFRLLAAQIQKQGRLDPGLTLDDAVRLIWVLTSPHMYEYLVVDGGWSLKRYRGHVIRLLRRALLT
ncbi:MAG TPA: helix-turn-helix domain-containing protein [Candidatus Dormibacteraeota bacterium]|nr:helix-turn-helix domain-containing protein [Candidatus Dormibacteraeota bacterium]